MVRKQRGVLKSRRDRSLYDFNEFQIIDLKLFSFCDMEISHNNVCIFRHKTYWIFISMSNLTYIFCTVFFSVFRTLCQQQQQQSISNSLLHPSFHATFIAHKRPKSVYLWRLICDLFILCTIYMHTWCMNCTATSYCSSLHFAFYLYSQHTSYSFTSEGNGYVNIRELQMCIIVRDGIYHISSTCTFGAYAHKQ